MNRRLGLALAGVLALIAGIAVGAQENGGSAQAATAQTSQRPNIIVLETDDQTLAEMAVLPNVRRLIGDEGVTFDNHFVAFSLCCPDRKSTRLNSSHLVISYAVFCLKK